MRGADGLADSANAPNPPGPTSVNVRPKAHSAAPQKTRTPALARLSLLERVRPGEVGLVRLGARQLLRPAVLEAQALKFLQDLLVFLWP